jgi:CHAT domain-containing protein/tetratricopeptide (TPR) repeat protein
MSSAAPARDALALAERAYETVQVSPRRAETLAERALARARDEADVDAQITALHALSWAQHVQGNPRTVATARAGIRIAERHGDRRRAALLRRRLALSLANAGKRGAAEREIDRAIADLTGRDQARSEVFRIAIHRNAYGADAARDQEVIAASQRALRALRRPEDALWRARILYNRGILHFERGDGAGAERDFRRALELYRDMGADAAAIDAAAALAGVALLRGDVVGCLEQVENVRASLPQEHVCFALEEAEVQALAQARLIPEAEAAIRRHLELCLRAGRATFASATLLDLALMSLAAGRTGVGVEIAGRLTRVYAARRSPVGVARACAVRLQAQLVEGSCRPSGLRVGLRAASALAAAGWTREELRLRVVLVRVALAIGSARQARRQLALAESLRRHGTAADRIELHHARALVAASDGRVAAARRSLRIGLRLLDGYRAAFGAAEVRVTASSLGVDSSRLGLRLAFADGSPAQVLAWAELMRASTLRLPAVRPPRNGELRRRLSELRLVAARVREDGSERHLAAQQAEHEAAIRAITRRTRGGGGRSSSEAKPRLVASAVGDHALVEYVELDGTLRAVTVVRGRLAIHELDPAAVADELDWLRFSVASVARRRDTFAAAGAAAAALDAALLAPIRSLLGDAPLVVVPTGALHALPWAALPSLQGRPVVVAPSFSLWSEVTRRPRSQRQKVALASGPGLRHATREIAAVASLYRAAEVLDPKQATAEAVLRALDGAAIAHVACHGRFRADSPLFSSLELADGPLNAYDLQRLRRPPEVLVLSACDLALSDRFPGDELLGMAAVLLGMGTRTIIASVVPVPDAVTRRLMLAFHRELAAGTKPAAALAHAQASLRGDSAATAGFVCLGSG